MSPSDDEFAWLEQDIKKRLFQGRGEAFYELGVEGMYNCIPQFGCNSPCVSVVVQIVQHQG